MIISTACNGTYLYDFINDIIKKICISNQYIIQSQAIEVMKDDLTIFKKANSFIRFENGEIITEKKIFGDVLHIKKLDEDNCIICGQDKVYLLNIKDNRLYTIIFSSKNEYVNFK